MLNLAIFWTSLDYYPPALENAANCLNSETKLLRSDDRPMSSQSLVKFGACTPKNRPEKYPTPKIVRRKCAKHQR